MCDCSGCCRRGQRFDPCRSNRAHDESHFSLVPARADCAVRWQVFGDATGPAIVEPADAAAFQSAPRPLSVTVDQPGPIEPRDGDCAWRADRGGRSRARVPPTALIDLQEEVVRRGCISRRRAGSTAPAPSPSAVRTTRLTPSYVDDHAECFKDDDRPLAPARTGWSAAWGGRPGPPETGRWVRKPTHITSHSIRRYRSPPFYASRRR
jgi:hypothetical protein